MKMECELMKEEELRDLEKKLWDAADKMRGAVPVSDYKFIVLGLIFLKYISDSFEDKYQEVKSEGYGLEEDRESYIADSFIAVATLVLIFELLILLCRYFIELS